MVKRITGRQKEVLDFISNYMERHRFPPTLRDIASHFGMSSLTAARDHLRSLEKKGYLKRDADKSRAIVLIGGVHGHGLPIIGEVAAGTPIMAEENYQGFVNLGDYFSRDSGVFVLRVKGDSMIGIGIREGDLVVVRHQATLNSGDIGVIYLGQEATVKRVFFEAEHIRLQPENDRLSPVIVPRDDPDFRIGGKVVGVIRKY